jgi:rhodanese-related sulfurtransferase
MRILIPITATLGILLAVSACKPSSASDSHTVGTASTDTTAVATDTFEVLSPAAFDQKLRQTSGAVLVDVRTPDEYAGGYIAGAQLMDISDPRFPDNLAALDKAKPYFLYCAAGVRSHRAFDMMKAQGFTRVFELEGGITAWEAASLPVATDDPE